MAGQIGLTDAVAALKEYFGEELHESEAEGRRDMIDALKRKFNIPDSEARELVSSLEQAHSVRWVPAGGRTGAIPPVGFAGSGTAVPPYPAAAVPSEAAPGEGYWRFS